MSFPVFSRLIWPPLGWALMGLLFLAACGGQPRVEVETERFDLGQMVNGEVVTRELVVRNTGTADLVIQQVTTSCGCTTAEVEPTVIPPGGMARLRITFDSGAHGPTLQGRLVRQVFLSTNDPERPEVVVEFSAEVLLPDTPADD